MRKQKAVMVPLLYASVTSMLGLAGCSTAASNLNLRQETVQLEENRVINKRLTENKLKSSVAVDPKLNLSLLNKLLKNAETNVLQNEDQEVQILEIAAWAAGVMAQTSINIDAHRDKLVVKTAAEAIHEQAMQAAQLASEVGSLYKERLNLLQAIADNAEMIEKGNIVQSIVNGIKEIQQLKDTVQGNVYLIAAHHNALNDIQARDDNAAVKQNAERAQMCIKKLLRCSNAVLYFLSSLERSLPCMESFVDKSKKITDPTNPSTEQAVSALSEIAEAFEESAEERPEGAARSFQLFAAGRAYSTRAYNTISPVVVNGATKFAQGVGYVAPIVGRNLWHGTTKFAQGVRYVAPIVGKNLWYGTTKFAQGVGYVTPIVGKSLWYVTTKLAQGVGYITPIVARGLWRGTTKLAEEIANFIDSQEGSGIEIAQTR